MNYFDLLHDVTKFEAISSALWLKLFIMRKT